MPSVQKQSQQSAAAAAEGTVVVGVVMLAVIGVVIGGRRHSRRSRGGGDTTINLAAVLPEIVIIVHAIGAKAVTAVGSRSSGRNSSRWCCHAGGDRGGDRRPSTQSP